MLKKLNKRPRFPSIYCHRLTLGFFLIGFSSVISHSPTARGGSDTATSQPSPYAAYNRWIADNTFIPASQPATQPLVKADYSVMADKATGGFTADAISTTSVKLRWSKIPGANNYWVLWSTSPKIMVNSPASLMTYDVKSSDRPEWLASAEPSTLYYYVICAQTNTEMLVIATGSCKTPAFDGPLVQLDQPATKPAK